MEQVFEFIGNHPLMVGGFVVLLILLVVTEIGRLRRGFREIGSAEAVGLINADACVIDVSATADFEKGHIIGAVNVPVSQLQESNKQLMKLKNRPVLVYCRNGVTSNQAALKLIQLGFNPVTVLRGGISQWEADKQPVTRGK
ncbi:MAG: rhodanese-like domain-containing protein [Xanthomonadales bacterium]|jgi:rhodanese-related sulfurtransferase|nr:rhodanese-like domain-containing protein [Xanthomonadales bacterium]